MEPNVHKIEDHRRKYDRLRKERNERRIAREKEAQRAEAQVIPALIMHFELIVCIGALSSVKILFTAHLIDQ